MTAIDSLWVLYSDGWLCEKMAVHTLADHLVFSFQANVFIAGDKQDVVRGFANQGKVNWIRKKTTSVFLYWAVVLSCAPGSGL